MLGIARAQECREHVVGGETMDHRRHGLGGVVIQLRLAVGPDRAFQGNSRRPGQAVRVPPSRPLAVGRPEPSKQAVLDQARQASLGDAPVAEDEQGRELGRHDVAVHQPQQEAPVALGQCRPRRDPGRPSDAGASGRGQGAPPIGQRTSARSRASESGGIASVDDAVVGHGRRLHAAIGLIWARPGPRGTNDRRLPGRTRSRSVTPAPLAPGRTDNESIAHAPTLRTVERSSNPRCVRMRVRTRARRRSEPRGPPVTTARDVRALNGHHEAAYCPRHRATTVCVGRRLVGRSS